MSGMQGAHRGDQAGNAPLRARLTRDLTHPCDSVNDFHGDRAGTPLARGSP
jgi:hypothetical protein